MGAFDPGYPHGVRRSRPAVLRATTIWTIEIQPTELEITAEDVDGEYVRDQAGVWRYCTSLIAVPGAKDWTDEDGMPRIDAPELDLDPRVQAVARSEATYRHVRALAFDGAEAARRDRNDVVRAALRDGITYARIAELTGLSRGRIGLLRDEPSVDRSSPPREGGWVRSAAFYQRKLPRRRPRASHAELDAMEPRERAVAMAQAELERRIAHYSATVPTVFEQRAQALRDARAAGLVARQVAEICDLSPKRVNEIVAGCDYGRPRKTSGGRDVRPG
jgi:hypothetical protein